MITRTYDEISLIKEMKLINQSIKVFRHTKHVEKIQTLPLFTHRQVGKYKKVMIVFR